MPLVKGKWVSPKKSPGPAKPDSKIVYALIGGHSVLLNMDVDDWFKEQVNYETPLNEWHQQVIIHSNSKLAHHILSQVKPHDQLIVQPISNILSAEEDKKFANLYNRPSYFLALKIFAEHLKAERVDIAMPECKEELPLDESKFLMFYAAVQKAALDHPNKKITMMAYDKDDIHGVPPRAGTALYHYFLRHKHLVPENITVNFYRYGDITRVVGEHLEGNFTGKVEEIGALTGTGKPNTFYKETIIKLACHLAAVQAKAKEEFFNVLSLFQRCSPTLMNEIIQECESQKPVARSTTPVWREETPEPSVVRPADREISRSSSADVIDALRATPPSGEPSPSPDRESASPQRLATIVESPVLVPVASPAPEKLVDFEQLRPKN